MPTDPPYKLAPSATAFKAPHLKYAPPSLCNSLLYGLPAKSLSKLQRLQSAAASLVAGTSRLSHIAPLLYSLHWLPVKERIHYKIIYTDLFMALRLLTFVKRPNIYITKVKRAL